MATLHGFPVLLAGRRLCIVDMPDCWAIMNSLDAFPQASFRFPKDEEGWRDAVAQLERSDAPEPVAKRAPMVASQGVVTNPRRQFSIARIGIFFSAAVLGYSPWLAWGVIHHGGLVYKGDLFSFMNHGWRQDLAWILVGVSAFCALQALILPFARIKFFGSLCGFLALVPVLIGITQVHTFDPAGLASPSVAIGLGAWVGLGACAVLFMSWAVFPSKMRRSPPVRTDLLGEYGTVNSFAAAGAAQQFAGGTTPAPGGQAVAPDHAAGGQAPPPAAGRYVKQPDGPGGKAQLDGLPTLGAALTQLAHREQTDPPGGQSPDGQPSSGHGSRGTGAMWVPPTTMNRASVPMPQGYGQTGTVTPGTPQAAPQAPAPAPAPVQAPSATPSGHPAGWYADYTGTGMLRWWDGQQWTAHTHPAGVG